MYGQQLYGKRAVTKTKLTLKQSRNRGTNHKPKADSHTIYCIGLSHSTQLYNKSQLSQFSQLHIAATSDTRLGLR